MISAPPGIVEQYSTAIIAVVCGSLKFVLELEGFVVRDYGSAAELLAADDVSSYDCLVIEQVMPGLRFKQNGVDHQLAQAKGDSTGDTPGQRAERCAGRARPRRIFRLLRSRSSAIRFSTKFAALAGAIKQTKAGKLIFSRSAFIMAIIRHGRLWKIFSSCRRRRIIPRSAPKPLSLGAFFPPRGGPNDPQAPLRISFAGQCAPLALEGCGKYARPTARTEAGAP